MAESRAETTKFATILIRRIRVEGSFTNIYQVVYPKLRSPTNSLTDNILS